MGCIFFSDVVAAKFWTESAFLFLHLTVTYNVKICAVSVGIGLLYLCRVIDLLPFHICVMTLSKFII